MDHYILSIFLLKVSIYVDNMLFIKGFSLNKDVAVIISGNINKDIKVLIPDIFDGNCNKYRYWIVQVNMYIGFYIEQFIFEIEKVL